MKILFPQEKYSEIPQSQKGKWTIVDKDEWYGDIGECPSCHYRTLDTNNFCPNCGRPMEKIDENL